MKPNQIIKLKPLVKGKQSVHLETIEKGEPREAAEEDNLVATTMTLMSNRVCKIERSSILTRE